jgi:DNA-binding transcriptional MocR family regulator
MLTRTRQQTLTEQLAARFSERIRSRLILPGSRLPSVRECARQQDVSPATVVAAYDQLVAAGWVEARKQRGFYVRDVHFLKKNEPAALADTGVSATHLGAQTALSGKPRIDATALIRGMFTRGVSPRDAPHQPGMGVLPSDWMDNDFLGPALRKASRGRGLLEASLRYGEPLGDAALREALSVKLRDLALDAPPERIITTLGATQALDIASRSLLKAGDPVMVEEPGWAVEFARLDALGMRILPVPRGPEGPDLEVMARYCQEHQPKLYVSVSVLHNPTGACLSPASAHRVLQLAQQHDFYVVEDDTYSHLAPAHAPRMAALDGLQRTTGGWAIWLCPSI